MIVLPTQCRPVEHAVCPSWCPAPPGISQSVHSWRLLFFYTSTSKVQSKYAVCVCFYFNLFYLFLRWTFFIGLLKFLLIEWYPMEPYHITNCIIVTCFVSKCVILAVRELKWCISYRRQNINYNKGVGHLLQGCGVAWPPSVPVWLSPTGSSVQPL